MIFTVTDHISLACALATRSELVTGQGSLMGFLTTQARRVRHPTPDRSRGLKLRRTQL